MVTIVILLREKCGRSKCISVYLTAMAVADLMCLVFDVILFELHGIYYPDSFLDYTAICRMNFFLIFTSVECSVWLTVAFTFDRYVAICCQKLRTQYCTERTAKVVVATIWGLSILENIPRYFVSEPHVIIDNIASFCIVKASRYTELIWISYLWIDIIFLTFIPFLLVLLFNGLTIKHILLTSRIRKALRGSDNDSELENRKKSIVLLLLISANFILLWMVILTHFICAQITEVEFLQTNYSNPFAILEQAGHMLQYLSSCTNTIIYVASQAKFREDIKILFKYPLTLLLKVQK
ncbi:G-protein coupled receptor 15-like [Chiloscyllium plagiosum]|uniref:G-protein coupled receptor 15-like n=1 Tax=Chiloscyllium plagiosum TaxID=36176 RepID=UPI001CB84E6D|nr:G-protein coupled receptor 15-like [Chiloscyllium plagiosum]